MKLEDLYKLIEDRKKNLPKDSYTTSLFEKGLDKIIQKVGEESVETLLAAKNESKKRLIEEVADLLYHLLVLLVKKGVTLKDIDLELEKRHKKG